MVEGANEKQIDANSIPTGKKILLKEWSRRSKQTILSEIQAQAKRVTGSLALVVHGDKATEEPVDTRDEVSQRNQNSKELRRSVL